MDRLITPTGELRETTGLREQSKAKKEKKKKKQEKKQSGSTKRLLKKKFFFVSASLKKKKLTEMMMTTRRAEINNKNKKDRKCKMLEFWVEILVQRDNTRGHRCVTSLVGEYVYSEKHICSSF